MTIQQELGKRGEEFAVAYLEDLGYTILERNWRYKKAEVDIIAKDDGILVCIEVKSRSYDYYGPPDASINRQKESLLIEALQSYMEVINHEWEIRFDIMTIRYHADEAPAIKHLKAAFFPDLSG